MKKGFFALCLCVALVAAIIPPVQVFSTDDAITVSGGTVTSQEELLALLNASDDGDPASLTEDGTVFLSEPVRLESTIRLTSGDFRLDGDSIIKAGNFWVFNLTGGAKLQLGTVNRQVDDSITLDGEGATFSCPAILINEGCTLEIYSGVKITNRISTEAGGAINNRGELMMYDGVIENCRADKSGGAICNTDKGVATLSGGLIKGCSASEGGAVSNRGKLTLSGTQIESCFGGAISNIGDVSLTASVIKDCHSTQSGGGINSSSGNLELAGGEISECSADISGGAVYANGPVVHTGTYISSCTAGHSGGGIEISVNGNYVMSGGTITGCEADIGGNIRNSGRLEISGGQISFGKARMGGGIFNEGYLHISSSGQSTNKADFGATVFNYGEFHLSGFPYIDKKYDIFLVLNGGDDDHPLIIDSEMKADPIACLTPGTAVKDRSVIEPKRLSGDGITVLTGEFASQASSHFVISPSDDGRQFRLENGVTVRVKTVWENPLLYIAVALVYIALIAVPVILVRMHDRKKSGKQ